jgi:hypothetical protein
MDLMQVSAMLTAITAITAIVLSLYSIRLQKKTAAANVKPILQIDQVMKGNDSREVHLHNWGVGTAIITSINFRKGNKHGRSLISVLDRANKKYDWHYEEFGDDLNYLRGGKKKILLRLRVSDLMSQGLSDTDARRILASAGDQVTGTEVSISYKDVLGNDQGKLYRTTIDPPASD